MQRNLKARWNRTISKKNNIPKLTDEKFKNMKNYVFVKEIEFKTFKKGKFLVRKILDLDVFVDEVYKYFLLIF